MPKKDQEKGATLADLMIREWSRSAYRHFDPHRWLARTIAGARKFVLDERMSGFMSDLANSGMPAGNPRLLPIVEGMRTLSRLPHKVTWIEFDMHARCRQMMKYQGMMRWPLEETPKRNGWLLLQHPHIESAFMAIECASQSLDRHGKLEDTPNASLLAYTWTTDDAVLPWASLPTIIRTDNSELVPQSDVTASFVLTGVIGYQSPHVGWTWAPWVTKDERAGYAKDHRAMSNAQSEVVGDLRYLWGLLSAINDTPVSYTRVVPQTRHMVGGSYKRFVEHTMITLNVPHKANLAKLAKRVQRDARRRAHQVRGHFRKDWRFPLAAFCEHAFEAISDTHLMQCKLCSGRKIWIREHERGDASVGFVTHDYRVEHPQTNGEAK